MKKYDESLTKQKAFALTANAATLLRLQRPIFLRIFSHWSQPKVASHTLRAAQPPDFFIYYMSKKIENKQKKHKKKTDKIVYLILLSLLQPGEFLCRTDGISNINSIKWNSIFHMCNCVCFIECIWNIPILIVIIIHHEFL